jgi:hypothetical protein
MARSLKIVIVSDIHYASPAEQARGDDYEINGINNPLLRAFVQLHRRYVWKHHPLQQNHIFHNFLEQVHDADYLIANGDYSCNSAFVGVSDDAAFESVRQCLAKFREHFGLDFRATFGDHELGKISFFGGRGGMRLASWRRAREQLGLEPLWRLELGKYLLVGVVSSLIALPVFEHDTLPEERAQWEQLRIEHLTAIRELFAAIRPQQRILLFCHDPTALPFLHADPVVRSRLPQIEQTIIGHLHSNLVLWKSRLLAGMPPIQFLGHTARRLSTALSQAKLWRPFNVRLCPALGGIELLKDGGYYLAELQPDAEQPVHFKFQPIKQKRAG